MKKTILFILLLVYILQLAIVTAINDNQPFRPYQLAWEMNGDSPNNDLSNIDMSPSGDFIVNLNNSERRTINILNGSTGKVVRSIPTFSQPKISTNGEFIVINDVYSSKGNEITTLNYDLKQIWSYRDINNSYNSYQNGISISSRGNNIISNYITDVDRILLLYFFDDNKLMWKKEFREIATKSSTIDVSITSDGNFVSINSVRYSTDQLETSIILILDQNGNVVQQVENFFKLKLSGDGKYAVGVNARGKVVFFDIITNKTFWEYAPHGRDSSTSIDQTDDSNITVFNSGTSFFVLDKNGNLVQQFDLNKRIRDIRISLNGTHLLVKTDDKIYVFSNNLYKDIIPNWIYPGMGQVFKSNWSKEGKFSISDSFQWLKQKISTFSEFDPTIIYIGSILVVCVIVIFSRPYYKRLKLKQDMAKTPTDWCPNCLKFTGGATICPHCGKATITEKYSDKKKREKKDK